jgi:hypothetical protein
MMYLVQGVEPIQQLGAWLGAFQAFIQLFADIAGQAGDCAIAGIHGFEGCCWFQHFNCSTWLHYLFN